MSVMDKPIHPVVSWTHRVIETRFLPMTSSLGRRVKATLVLGGKVYRATIPWVDMPCDHSEETLVNHRMAALRVLLDADIHRGKVLVSGSVYPGDRFVHLAVNESDLEHEQA